MRTLARVLAFALLAATAAHAKPPLWDKVIPGKGRFKLLKAFDGEAVLDKETGLVWQREPATDLMPHLTARSMCLGVTVGPRRGWRLPEAEELISLTDPGVAASPYLPPDAPFALGDPPLQFWSSGSFGPGDAFMMELALPMASQPAFLSLPVATMGRAWCVRGGSGRDRGSP